MPPEKPQLGGVTTTGIPAAPDRCDIVPVEANRAAPLRGDFSAMARRRFQDPKPFREGNWWWITPRKDEFIEGRFRRVRTRVKVCEADTSEREARKIADELLRPMNQGLETIGSATRFADFIKTSYYAYLDGKATTTQASYNGTLNKYLMPAFGEMPLRNISLQSLQNFFSGLAKTSAGPTTVLKIKEVLSSVLAQAVKHDLLVKNPVLQVEIPHSKRVNKRRRKPHLTPEEFTKLLLLVDEPYATMIYVAVFSGLRVSELIGLKWEDVDSESLTVDERCCRGNWSVPKTEGSSGTIGVARSAIQRIQALKTLEVEINWGGKGAKKKFRVIRSAEPNDLVFQSVRTGSSMNDQNILRRHLRPAAEKLKIDPKKVTWRSLRTSYGTWMVEAGANPKDVQAQMRHSRISTTMEIYVQFVPESQQRAVARMTEMVNERVTKMAAMEN
jgi:integrase